MGGRALFGAALAAIAISLYFGISDQRSSCPPCSRLESSEMWQLALEGWTVDGEPQVLPVQMPVVSVANPISDDRLEAWLLDPLNPDEPQRVSLLRRQ